MYGVCAQEPGIDAQVQTVPETRSSWTAKHFPREKHVPFQHPPVGFSLCCWRRGGHKQPPSAPLQGWWPSHLPLLYYYMYYYIIIIAVILRALQ